MHDGMPYGRNQGQGHSREVDRQSPTGLIFCFVAYVSSNNVWWQANAEHSHLHNVMPFLNGSVHNATLNRDQGCVVEHEFSGTQVDLSAIASRLGDD